MCILPLSLPCLRGKVRPVRPPASGVLPASIFNPLDVSRDSMRAPICGSSLEHFLEKTLPVRGIRYTISFFEHLSSESVKNDHKKKKCEKLLVFVMFRAPSSKTHVIVERCCKNRVHATFIEFCNVFELVKMCLFPSVGRIFFLGAAKIRSGVRTRMLFF